MDIVSKGGEEHFINLSLNEINGLQICPQSWITVSRTWAAGWMVASKPGRYIKIQLISVSYAFSGCCVKTGRLYQNITVFRGNCPLNHSFWVSYTFCECLPGLLWTELEIDSSVSLSLRSSRRMFQCFVWRSIQLSTFARMARRRISSGFVVLVLWFLVVSSSESLLLLAEREQLVKKLHSLAASKLSRNTCGILFID